MDETGRNRKFGYVSTTPGSVLVLQFDSTLGLKAADKSDKKVMLHLAYLTTYENIGSANVSCSECHCEPMVINALDVNPHEKLSVIPIRAFQASCHVNCTLHIILNATKFKVMGISVDRHEVGLVNSWAYMHMHDRR